MELATAVWAIEVASLAGDTDTPCRGSYTGPAKLSELHGRKRRALLMVAEAENESPPAEIIPELAIGRAVLSKPQIIKR